MPELVIAHRPSVCYSTPRGAGCATPSFSTYQQEQPLRLTTTWAVRLIQIYQRYISPYKGFRCAHSVAYGSPSCSAAVKQIVLQHGLVAGWPAIRRRFQACRQAARLLNEAAGPAPDNEDKKTPKQSSRRCDNTLEFCTNATCALPDCVSLAGAGRAAKTGVATITGACDACACSLF